MAVVDKADKITLENTAAAECLGVSFSYTSSFSAVSLQHTLKPSFNLHNLHFQIKEGEFVLLQGGSGSGKTTLLKLLGGLIVPRCGSVKIRGREISSMSETSRARFRQQHIGFIFQDANLDGRRTVWQNILLPLYFGNQSLAEGQKRALELLKILNMSEYKDVKASLLSGGQKQRVAAVRAFINQPALLLADEPMAHLDVANSVALLETMAKLQQIKPTSILMTAHYLPEADFMPNRIVTMENLLQLCKLE
ncbi:MAG: ABC transporter ATP-binding protein [Candidatus Bruticola sp.]